MTRQTANTYYPVRSWGGYRRKHPNAGVILDLENSPHLPASKWRTQHLIACRIIQKNGGKILPILREFAPKPKELKDHQDWANIEPLVIGLKTKDLLHKSRWELERENGSLGTLWSALAKCAAPVQRQEPRRPSPEFDQQQANDNQEPPPHTAITQTPRQKPHQGSPEAGSPSTRPQRVRRPPQREGFMPTRNSQISSSPSEQAASEGRRVGSSESEQPSQESQESFEPGPPHSSEVDEDEHDDRTKSEVLTVNLAGAFIRYVLNFCAVQDPGNATMLEFREDPYRVRYDLPKLQLDATGDGGIWVVATQRPGVFPWALERRLALLEAKKSFQRVDDKNRPVVSDANWSQYTCEAVTAFLENPDQDEVFVVAMTQTFMRFLCFHRTEAYVQYLRSNNIQEQKSSDACLEVTESEFFALDNEDGRKYALCNLLGLVKFWDKQRQEAENPGEESENMPSTSLLGMWNDDDFDGNDFEENEDPGMNNDDEDNNPRVGKRKRRFP